MKWSVKGQTPAWLMLLAPFRYLAVRHEVKRRIDYGWPLALAALTMGTLWLLPVASQVLGEGGYLKGVRELIALFAAFFVVALAAVSTFDRPTLDMVMEGTPPTLDGRDLTRRQFVCRLFGYLAALSFVLFLMSVAAEIVAPSFRYWFSPHILWWIRAVLGTLFAFGFWNMVATTFLGIWFLIERVHLLAPENGQPAQPPFERPRSIGRRDAA
jgi:hypothetical protein